jgi:hypothetical protein
MFPFQFPTARQTHAGAMAVTSKKVIASSLSQILPIVKHLLEMEGMFAPCQQM